MIRTLQINDIAICSYQIKDRTLFIRMWGVYEDSQDQYVEVIRGIEAPNRKEFDRVKFLPISNPSQRRLISTIK